MKGESLPKWLYDRLDFMYDAGLISDYDLTDGEDTDGTTYSVRIWLKPYRE